MIQPPHADKISAAESWLTSTFGNSAQQVQCANWDHAWLIKLDEIQGFPLKLRLEIPFSFPDEPIRVYWQHNDNIVRPHCWPNGELCLVEQPYSFDDVEKDLNELLYQVVELLQKYAAQSNREDLIKEPRPYWNSFLANSYGNRQKLNKISVLLAAEPSTTQCQLIYGYRSFNQNWFLADTQGDAYRMAGQTSEGVDGLSYSIGVRIPISSAWYPDQFPRSWTQVYQLLTDSGRLEEVEALLETERRRDPWIAVVFLYFDAPGVSYGLAIASEHDNGRARGHRFVKRPLKHRTMAEFLLAPHNGLLWHCETEHLDSDTLFLRLDCEHMPERNQARVLLVGCGSLGGLLADELSRAGVRNITLVDNQVFDSENLCRHILGMEYLGQFKADALKNHLERQMPLMQVLSFPVPLTRFLAHQAPSPNDYDLILAMTGESGPIWTLDSWRNQSTEAPPMIVGWAESFGVAGHAALLMDGKTMVNIEQDGLRLHNMAQWQPGTVDHLRAIPGCSGTFQPMGRIKLMHIASMVAEMTLSVIDGQQSTSHVLSRIEKVDNLTAYKATSTAPEIHASIHPFPSAVVEREID